MDGGQEKVMYLLESTTRLHLCYLHTLGVLVIQPVLTSEQQSESAPTVGHRQLLEALKNAKSTHIDNMSIGLKQVSKHDIPKVINTENQEPSNHPIIRGSASESTTPLADDQFEGKKEVSLDTTKAPCGSGTGKPQEFTGKFENDRNMPAAEVDNHIISMCYSCNTKLKVEEVYVSRAQWKKKVCNQKNISTQTSLSVHEKRMKNMFFMENRSTWTAEDELELEPERINKYAQTVLNGKMFGQVTRNGNESSEEELPDPLTQSMVVRNFATQTEHSDVPPILRESQASASLCFYDDSTGTEDAMANDEYGIDLPDLLSEEVPESPKFQTESVNEPEAVSDQDAVFVVKDNKEAIERLRDQVRENTEHYKPHKKDGGYVCYFCGHTSIRRKEFWIHESLHFDGKDRTCPYCLKFIPQLNLMDKHIRSHTGTLFQCELCQKNFTNRGYLKYHMQFHVTGRPVKCSECEETFRSKVDLRIHMQMHEGKTTCQICNVVFRSVANLTLHRNRFHSGDVLTACELCGVKVRKVYMHRHMRSVHTESKTQFQCDVCGKNFKKLSYLKTHQMVHKVMDEPVPCTECGKMYSNAYNLKAHQRRHRYKKQEAKKSKKHLKNSIGQQTQESQSVYQE